MNSKTIVLDIGGSSIKVGVDGVKDIRTLPNSIFKAKAERRKAFISSQIDTLKDHSELFYLLPFQKGYLVNWDVQRQIWDYIFGKDVLNIKPSETSAIITEPHFNFASIQEDMNEIFFEEFEFQSILRTNATTLSYHQYETEFPNEKCCVIVDSGFSFTHVVPYHKGKKIKSAMCRIDVGGKLLTNHFKEIISYRQLQVMDETYVIDQVKQDCCYVSLDFMNDMEAIKHKGNSIACEYILPDYTQIKRGYIKPKSQANEKQKTQQQVIHLAGERISVPEILFHPSDIGNSQMGIAESIVHCIEKCPKELQPHMYRNIYLTGGNCLFPNFKERVEQDIRCLTPTEFQIRVTLPKNPQQCACEGGLKWLRKDNFKEHLLTYEEYQEAGQSACQRQFTDI